MKPYTPEELRNTAPMGVNLIPLPPWETDEWQIALAAEQIIYEGERAPRAGTRLSPPADR